MKNDLIGINGEKQYVSIYKILNILNKDYNRKGIIGSNNFIVYIIIIKIFVSKNIIIIKI